MRMQTLYNFALILEAQQAPVQDPNAPPPPPDPTEVMAQINQSNNENIQKYVLFSKIVDLKYQLENRDLHKIDPLSYNESLYFLNILIKFFDSFQFDDLVLKVNVILDEIAKNLKVGSKVNK
jgi:hypothetical protein